MIDKLEFDEHFNRRTNGYIINTIIGDGYCNIQKDNFYETFVTFKGKLEHIKRINKDTNVSRNLMLSSVSTTEVQSYSKLEIFSKEKRQIKSPKIGVETITDMLGMSVNYINHQDINEGDEIYSNENYLFENIISEILIEFIEDKSNFTDVPIWLREACFKMTKKENFIEGLYKFIELSGMSQEHLTRELKKAYGITPTQFINNLRLIEASNMLVYTKKSIIDIIFECGFNNTSYFNKLFRERFKLTPKIYRNNNRHMFY
ncbi:MAG: helix-turn-helix transcriptional regulator [Romboutsia sp.]|uniref:helix-turn-helix transcriptional regulator n=1 Tax=Romboutsia sp. TaxID=1965302 RepID=UPI003F34C245